MTQYWFIGNPRHGSKLVLFVCTLAFIVILLGAYTRLTDAGLSCPDWPNCFGYLTAPHTSEQLQGAAQRYPSLIVNIKKAWTEMTHRYFAGTEGLLIILVVGAMLSTKKTRNVKSIFIALILLSLLASQVLLGMLTVTAKLKPAIVESHLVTGISILCMLWWVYLESALHHTPVRKSSFDLLPALWAGLLIVGAQISLGGWVSTHYAGLACIDFPYCNGQILPTLQWENLNTDLITIHMLHRIGAVITAAYFLFLACYLFRNNHYKAFSILFVLLISLQLTLGVLNIIWLRPVTIALMHHATAILILLTTLTALVKAHIESRENRYAIWPA